MVPPKTFRGGLPFRFVDSSPSRVFLRDERVGHSLSSGGCPRFRFEAVKKRAESFNFALEMVGSLVSQSALFHSRGWAGYVGLGFKRAVVSFDEVGSTAADCRLGRPTATRFLL